MTRIFKAMEWCMAVLAGLALLAMMIITVIDVIGRYGFHHSLFGASEMIECLMVAVIFAGIAFITAGDQHIKVEIFEPAIRRRFPKLQRWAVLIFSLVMYAIIAGELFRYTHESFTSGKRTVVLEYSQWLLSGTAAFFTLVGVILFLFAIIITRGFPEKIGHLDHLKGDEVSEEHLET